MKWVMMALGAALAVATPGLARAELACADLKGVKLDHAEVTAASLETSGAVELC